MQDVYQQVIVTCTTINVIICLGTLFSWIGIKVSDHREKKRKEREEKERAEKAAAESNE